MNYGFFLDVNILLFLIGFLGLFFVNKNMIVLLMVIEIMLLAINLNFLVMSIFLNDLLGQMIGLLVLTVAAAESAIGLAILVVYYRLTGNIWINKISNLKG